MDAPPEKPRQTEAPYPKLKARAGKRSPIGKIIIVAWVIAFIAVYALVVEMHLKGRAGIEKKGGAGAVEGAPTPNDPALNEAAE